MIECYKKSDKQSAIEYLSDAFKSLSCHSSVEFTDKYGGDDSTMYNITSNTIYQAKLTVPTKPKYLYMIVKKDNDAYSHSSSVTKEFKYPIELTIDKPNVGKNNLSSRSCYVYKLEYGKYVFKKFVPINY